MQWTNRRPIGRWEFVDRIRLRRAALRYAAHGWAVTPGACLVGDRFACGRPGCPVTGCHPAIESWADDASTDPARVARWWRCRPYTVLLATGRAFDALEVPAAAGRRALGDARGPVAVLPDGRCVFLVRPGGALRPELATRLDVLRHGLGSWIPAAPSHTPAGPVRWMITPAQAGWRLPDPAEVQALLLTTLGHRPRATGGVPRQLSTARRAA
jgi:hypothetical protein